MIANRRAYENVIRSLAPAPSCISQVDVHFIRTVVICSLVIARASCFRPINVPLALQGDCNVVVGLWFGCLDNQCSSHFGARVVHWPLRILVEQYFELLECISHCCRDEGTNVIQTKSTQYGNTLMPQTCSTCSNKRTLYISPHLQHKVALVHTCMARRKSLAGIDGKMADLSDCMGQGVKSYGASDCQCDCMELPKRQ